MKKKIAPGFWWDADTGTGFADFRVGGRHSRRVRATFPAVAYRAALSAFSSLKDREKRSAGIHGNIPTLRAYWKNYVRLRLIRPSTFRNYEYMLNARLFDRLGDIRLDRISPPRLLELRAELLRDHLSTASVNRHIGLVRMLLNEARLRGVLREHPVPSGTVPSLKESQATVAFLSEKERKGFLSAFEDEKAFLARLEKRRVLGPVKVGGQSLNPRRFGGSTRSDTEGGRAAFLRFKAAQPLFLCAFDTGLSRADLVSLSWHQIDLDGRTIRMKRTKTDAPLVIPMTKRLYAALGAIRPSEPRSEEAVFHTVEGERWSNISLRRYFAIAKDLAKIQRPFRFHDMRHDFASALAQQGVSLFVIAQLLGHASTRMTMRYAHLHPTNLRTAVDSLKGR